MLSERTKMWLQSGWLYLQHVIYPICPVEWISSMLLNKWSNVQNRCSVELIKSEILISLNFELPCAEFHSYFEGQTLLNETRSGRKSWKVKWRQTETIVSKLRDFCGPFHRNKDSKHHVKLLHVGLCQTNYKS